MRRARMCSEMTLDRKELKARLTDALSSTPPHNSDINQINIKDIYKNQDNSILFYIRNRITHNNLIILKP